MAGLLDMFGGSDPQTQGLLAAAAGILNASGPSLMPRSFGQVVGAGIGGFQQGQQQALAQQAAMQNLKINNFKLQDAESDLKNQEAQRAEATRLAEFLRNRGIGGATAPMPVPQSAASSFMGAMSPAQAQPQAQEPNAPANMNMALYQKRLQLADDLRNAGFSTQADAAEAAALKFQPKVKGWEKVQQGGKVMFAPFFEDGTSGAPVPLEVAEKLEFKSTGGKTLGLNPFTGSTVTSYNNTISPDAQSTANTAAARLNFDKSQVGKPTFNLEAGGFVMPPTKDNPTGKIVAPQGFTPKQTNAPVEFSKSAAGLNELQSALSNYENVIKEVGGTRVLPSSEKGAKLKASFTAVQMGLKNAMELGALAGPDIEILGGMLADPTSVTGMMYGPASIGKQIEQTRKYLDNRTQAVEKVFGRKVPKADVPAENNGWSITKVN